MKNLSGRKEKQQQTIDGAEGQDGNSGTEDMNLRV
jgi:hypothetical protein